MEPNENKTGLAFPPEMYERAKAAKEATFAFVDELRNGKNMSLARPDDFSALEKLVQEQPTDVRIVIGLGRFNWNKGLWDFDAPSTRAVMSRMTNLDDPTRRRTSAMDYFELHLKYDAISTEDHHGFRRHTITHNIYSGSYVFDDESEEETDAT